ncbi:MAG: RNA-guided pseudouridylation complex pseudouridine synthase subunit Cbf5 [Candidatus Odinarchaeota archaeon]|nr:RNA-guided pseudouridylation complex pseudouridine synthase subunit Cbf5 [Candidatus Odinarchaeota archaeon]
MGEHKLPSDKQRVLVEKAFDVTSPDYGKPPSKRSVEELLNLGVINLDKPAGPTSHEVVAWLKKILKLNKAGHSGTLDPPVTGVLPVALEDGTKVLQALLNCGKEYVGIMKLHSDVPRERVEEVFKMFTGPIYQRPPLRSSVKRKVRIRRVYYLDLLEMEGRDILFLVGCEAGTYIRKLCVHGDSELILEDGRVVRIKDLLEDLRLFDDVLKGKIRVLSYSEGKAKFSRILGIYKIPSDKKVVRVRTESGILSELTEDHEVLVSTVDGLRWIEASKLREGDWVLTPSIFPIQGWHESDERSKKVFATNGGEPSKLHSNVQKDNLLTLVGLTCRLIVDGLCKFEDGSIHVDRAAVPKFLELIKNSVYASGVKINVEGDGISISDESFLETLDETGILNGELDGITGMPNSSLLEFIVGYITPDIHGNRGEEETLKVPVSGYKMGRRLHYIMRRIGLSPSLEVLDGKFYLSLEGNSIDALFNLMRKSEGMTVDGDASFEDFKGVDSKRLLPLHVKRAVVDVLKSYGIVPKGGALENVDLKNPEKPISKGELLELLKYIEGKVSNEEIIYLKKFAESEFHIERISSVEKVDEWDDFVYDITVEETHNFILNFDFVVKNCHDIGLVLGCGAHMTELRRTRSGPFKEGEDLVTLQDVADAYFIWKNEGDESLLRKVIKPIEYAVKHLPRIVVRDSAVDAICHGADLAAPGVLKVDTSIGPNDLVAILTLKGELVALARAKFSTTKILKMNKGIVADVERVIMKPGTYPPWYLFKSKKQ